MDALPGAAAGAPITLPPVGHDPPRGVRRRFVPLGEGRSVAYAEAGAASGQRPAVVLIHGTLMTLEDLWLPLGPDLSADHRVVALDRPGHGLSARRRLVDASPWRQAALIRAALAALGIGRAVLVGHSFGGTVALCHAMAYPDETAGVVALAPLCLPEPRLEQVLFGPRFVPGGGEALAALLAGTADPALLPLLWRAIFLPQAVPAGFARRFPAGYAAGPGRMVAEGEDAMSVWPALTKAALRYGACRVPVEILGGTADIVVNNAVHGLWAAGVMPGARFAWVPGAGHMLHHFHRARIAAAVRGLTGAPPSGDAGDA